MEHYHYFPGKVPVLINVPHAGTYVPPDILERFCPTAKQLPDTDWYVDRLYAFARELGVHMLVATHSRFVVDVNRPPDNTSLYPGQFTTAICPTTLFDGTDIYEEGQAPNEVEVAARLLDHWHPYHDKLQQLVRTIRADARQMVLFDAHSIRSQVPLLFEGTLSDLNLGTSDGHTVDKALQDALTVIADKSPYSAVCNGRFKGGYITRHYGQPEAGIQAIQLELAQVNYMHEDPPFIYDETKAGSLQQTLGKLIEALIYFVRSS